MRDSPSAIRAGADPYIIAGLLVAGLGAATILGAYFFQYVLGYQPCPLCLEQRIPYYIAIPLSLLLVFGAWRGAPRALLTGALVIVLLLMLTGAGIAIYHSGVEWKWWAGPTDCSGPLVKTGGDLLRQLESIRIVRCDEAPWRLFGLSLAGYNVIITLVLAGIAAYGLTAARRSS